MFTKEQAAQFIADAHFRLDHGVSRIFRLVGPREMESSDPVKLLEINPMTPEAGIMPVALGASPAHGFPYSTVVIEISPTEFEQVAAGALALPDGWSIAEELRPGRKAVGAAS
jgi:hypothetical protein